jgi:hypothetical protein
MVGAAKCCGVGVPAWLQLMGAPGNRRCARAKAFSTGLLPRGSCQPWYPEICKKPAGST